MRRLCGQVGRIAARPTWCATCRAGARPAPARRPGPVRRRRGVRGGARGSPWSAPPTSSRRWSTIPTTSAPSPRPTRAATCSRWAAASCWRSTSPRSPSTSRARRSPRSSTPRRATVAEAGGTVAGGHTIRNPEPIFGLAVQGVVDPARVFRKSGARPGDVLVMSKPIGTALGAGRRHRGRQGRGHRRHAPAQPGRRRGAEARWATRCTRSPTSRGTAWPATAGRWPSAAAVRVVVDTAGIADVPGGAGRRRSRRAHRRRSAQPRLRRRAPRLHRRGRRGGAVHGPADVRWAAGRGRSVRRSTALSEMWWTVGVVEAGPASLVLR